MACEEGEREYVDDDDWQHFDWGGDLRPDFGEFTEMMLEVAALIKSTQTSPATAEAEPESPKRSITQRLSEYPHKIVGFPIFNKDLADLSFSFTERDYLPGRRVFGMCQRKVVSEASPSIMASWRG